LIWVGGLVTTYRAGMAVPDWPTTFGHNMLFFPWSVYGPWDLFIEHGHRLLGMLVGLLTIATVGVILWRDSRKWLKVVSVVALAAVCVQGSLGGMRVLLDETQLAKIHGCFGPAFFALTVALAVFTSRNWREPRSPRAFNGVRRLQCLAGVTTLLAYVQLVLGAQLRHLTPGAGPADFRLAVYFHLVVAAALMLHVLLLSAGVLVSFRWQAGLLRPALGLLALVLVQVALGAGAWLTKYGWPAWAGEHRWSAAYVVLAEGPWQALLATAHVAAGSLILGTSLLICLRSLRLIAEPNAEPSAPRLAMEAAA